MNRRHEAIKVYNPFLDEHIDIDKEIAELIEAIWASGIKTTWYCQVDSDDMVLIEFASEKDAEDFINAIFSGLDDYDFEHADFLYCRIKCKDGDKLPQWEHTALMSDTEFVNGIEPSVYFTMIIRFPVDDYEVLLNILKPSVKLKLIKS